MSNSGHKQVGWILVILGLFFILQYLLDWEFYWAVVLIIVGGVLFLYALLKRNEGGIFPGTFLFLLGMIFLLHQIDVIDPLSETWPLILIIIGVSFVMIFLVRPQDWGVLIPGGILIILGLIFLLRNYRYISWGTVGDILQWWPLILIVLGVKFLIPKRTTDE